MIVIGIGTLVTLKMQYPPRKRTSPAPAPVDPEYRVVARGLRVTALVGTLVAIACGVFAYFVLPRLGPWIQLIPGGMIATAIMFLVAAPRWER
jgi:hypothetical protein